MHESIHANRTLGSRPLRYDVDTCNAHRDMGLKVMWRNIDEVHDGGFIRNVTRTSADGIKFELE